MAKPKFRPLDPSAVSNAAKPSPAASSAASPVSSRLASPAPAASLLDVSGLISAIADAMAADSPLTGALQSIAKADSRPALGQAVRDAADLVESAKQLEDEQVAKGLSSIWKHSQKRALAREGALMLIGRLASFPAWAVGQVLELAFQALNDKDSGVQHAASQAIRAIELECSPELLSSAYLSRIWEILRSSPKPPVKVGLLDAIDRVAASCPDDYVENQFAEGIPRLTDVLHDIKPEVAKHARATMARFVMKLDNQDVTPRTDVILDALENPQKNVSECVKVLSRVTFVTEVTEPCLSVLVPIMSRALSVFSTQESLRQTVTVVENLTRLVHNPREILPFIGELKPGIERVVSAAALPEVRDLGSKALAVLNAAEADHGPQIRIDAAEARSALAELVDLSSRPEFEVTVSAQLLALCVNCREFSRLTELLQGEPLRLNAAAAHDVTKHFEIQFPDSFVPEMSADDGSIEVVNARFSLAYGGRMLLNKATLFLLKGHRYGLCGRNGCGKSTLMRAIATGKLEGFPTQDEVRTCFVEHRLQGVEEEAKQDLVTFLSSDPELSAIGRDEVADALADVGFDEFRRGQSVGSLSGGWKMKLELARAMLMKADVLLLDEPTNHLDVANVAWLESYLQSHTEITSLIVSHDSGFLDHVCTDIIHYESKKLAYYKGNLSEFVRVKPEAQSYYTLSSSVAKMSFPPPGILSGVRSNTRAIARMSNVSFKYPGATKYSLTNVSMSVSLSSRVGIIGPNGAGKSTLIKLLTGELVPSEGVVEKHPNLRIGYIAQHAFEYVEQHKEKTPNQYIQWRYRNGDDREVHLKQSRHVSEEEQAIMSRPQKIDEGRERILEAIIGRQKLKKTLQYEVQWKGMLPKHNTWMSREDLIERGFTKLVQAFDDHEASREGLGYRELTPPAIRKHFEDVGLDGDIADHVSLGSLSGGQLVKVVIAGSLWNNPQLLVLDEPTNYLDRDSLGGLAAACRDFAGGILLISHAKEFVSEVCHEEWLVEDGKLVAKQLGGAAPDASKAPTPAAETPADGSPTTAASTAPSSTNGSAAPSDADSPLNIKVRRKKKKLTRNELKEREVRRRLRYMEWLAAPKGTPKPEDTDDEA